MDGDTLRFFRLNGTPTFSREKVGVPFNTAQLPPIEYAPGDIVRRVRQQGFFSYRGRIFRISKAFTGYPVGLRPTVNDALMDVFSCHQKITQIDVAVV